MNTGGSAAAGGQGAGKEGRSVLVPEWGERRGSTPKGGLCPGISDAARLEGAQKKHSTLIASWREGFVRYLYKASLANQ